LLSFLEQKGQLTSPAKTTTTKRRIPGGVEQPLRLKGPKGKRIKAPKGVRGEPRFVRRKLVHGGPQGDAIAIGTRVAKMFGLSVTSTTGGNHVSGSYHYQRRAIDIAGGSKNMRRAFNYIRKNVPQQKLTELFYDPAGFYYDNGKRIRGQIGGHSDHVHFAV
jgi:hypothetical protein